MYINTGTYIILSKIVSGAVYEGEYKNDYKHGTGVRLTSCYLLIYMIYIQIGV